MNKDLKFILKIKRRKSPTVGRKPINLMQSKHSMIRSASSIPEKPLRKHPAKSPSPHKQQKQMGQKMEETWRDLANMSQPCLAKFVWN
jgi:hypothetical protein